MFLIFLILFAIFINFFGRDIIILAANYFFEIHLNRLIPVNKYYSESMNDLIVVYLIIFLLSGLIIYYKPIKKKILDLKIDKIKKLIFILFIFFEIILLFTMNTSIVSEGRGIGQFNRSLLGSFLRIKLLIYPILIYFLLTYKLKKHEWIFIFIFVLTIAINNALSGGRREAMYAFFILIVCYYMQYNINVSKLVKYILLFVVVITFSSIARIYGHDRIEMKLSFIFFLAFSSIFGALGTNGILWQIKEYVNNTTGIFYGKIFLNYIGLLFVPSFLLTAINGNEFSERSSYIFNSMYNVSDNMGYDFMMIADFYWNFGYFGYFLYICLTLTIVYFVKRYVYSYSVLKRSLVVLTTLIFIVGQRSDFLFFLKNMFYMGIAILIIHSIRTTYLIYMRKHKCAE